MALSSSSENLIQLQQGTKSYAARVLFNDASFSVNEGEHIGVIGPNGAGKTTLFKILIGEESLDRGQVIKSNRLRLGYLSQHATWNPGESVESFIQSDATLPVWELKALGRSLGLTETHYSQAIESLSGGYRMRAKLLNLIGQEPTLMLLDEPTNYLDLETLLVLEQFLQSFSGAFLLISHDREFLRRTTDHIIEIETGDITKYNGNIDDYFEQKEMLRTQLEARAFSVQEKRKQILDFVARFGAKNTKASQAQSRLKMMERMETIEIKPLPVTATIRIPPPARTGASILSMKDVDLGYPTKTVLKQVNLQLQRGRHLSVVGLNGAGKSTLLKSLAGKIEPLRGKVEYGYEVTLAFFNQYVAEDLSPTDTVYEALQEKAHPSILPQQILDLAGALLFSGDDLKKRISVLSGGERSRVALGQVLLQRASCLVLDEPTNHLDFQTVEALTQALQKFEGALIVVSHDRSFVRRISSQILEIHDGKASAYPGTYDEYVWSQEKGAFATLKSTLQKPTQDVTVAPQTKKESVLNYEAKKAFERRLKQLNNLIPTLEKKMVDHHEKLIQLNEQLNASPTSDNAKIVTEMGEIQSDLGKTENEWISASEERERLLKS